MISQTWGHGDFRMAHDLAANLPKTNSWAWVTDLIFNSAQMTKQNTDIIKLKAWFTPAEALKLVTYDNAELLALSGPRNPYPGRLGVIETDALANLIIVNGDPITDLDLMVGLERNFLIIMKDSKLHKKSVEGAPTKTSIATSARAD